VLWLLIGVPNQACKINLNKDGAEEAKRVLVGLIRAAACVLTGVYLLLMHLDRGPLVKLDKSSLAAGILVTVVLMGPFYKSVATVFWQRGLVGVISYQALKQYWGNTPMEVWKASPRPADSETTEGFWELLLARLLFHKGIEMDDMFTSYSGSADSGTAPSNRHGSVTEKPRQETGTSDMQSITS
jgi:hypothetical protein